MTHDEEHAVPSQHLGSSPLREDDERDPADRAPSWGPGSHAADEDTGAPSPEATKDEWDRVLDAAQAPTPMGQDPNDHPDVPDSARHLLTDDTAAG